MDMKDLSFNVIYYHFDIFYASIVVRVDSRNFPWTGRQIMLIFPVLKDFEILAAKLALLKLELNI